ncbi:MAG: hypothetical protein RDA78_06105 [Roseibium sp.]
MRDGVAHAVPRFGRRLFEIVLSDRRTDTELEGLHFAGLAGVEFDTIVRQLLQDLVGVFAITGQAIGCRAKCEINIASFGPFQKRLNARTSLEICPCR